MKTKNSPTTQEVRSVLGTQCQEQRTKIKHILWLYHTTQQCFICMYVTICLFCCSILEKTLHTSLVCPCCCCSVAKPCRTLYKPMGFSTPGFCHSSTISQTSLKLMSTELVMLSNPLILCHSLLLLPSIFPSIRVFSRESALCITWPQYWSFNFSISPSNEYSGLISFRMDWFDLLIVQGTVKSLLQHN